MYDRIALKEIAAFVRVADLGSFKDAARDLHLTPSALTQRVQKLEDTVGARLIDRTTRHAALTAVGRAFLPSAIRLLDQVDRSMSDLEDVINARGVRVTVASLISVATYVLPRALARLAADYPTASVRVLDDSEQDIADHVRRGEAEFGVDMRTSATETDSDLDVTPIAEDRFVLACRPDDPAAAGGPVAWADLAGLPLIMLGARSGTRRLLAETLPEGATAPNWRYEVQHLTTMIGMIEAGLGVGVAPRLAIGAIDARRLTYRPLAAPDLARTVVLLKRRGAALSPAAARLEKLLLEVFSKEQ